MKPENVKREHELSVSLSVKKHENAKIAPSMSTKKARKAVVSRGGLTRLQRMYLEYRVPSDEE